MVLIGLGDCQMRLIEVRISWLKHSGIFKKKKIILYGLVTSITVLDRGIV